MTECEVLKLALEAFDGWRKGFPDHWGDIDEKAVDAIQQALAQPEQEPVAWMSNESAYRLKHGGNSKGAVPVHAKQSSASKIPLYTHPQPKEDQEPVAWYIRETDSATTDGCWAEENLDICEPLYTHPQPKTEHWDADLVTAAQKVLAAFGTSTDDLQELLQALKPYGLAHPQPKAEQEPRVVIDASAPVVIDYNSKPKREWIGLTDEEVRHMCGSVPSMKEVVREAEAKLKEKNT